MITRYAFPLEDVERFQELYSTGVFLEKHQIEEREGNSFAQLTIEQLDLMAEKLIADGTFFSFFKEGAKEFSPLSMSLFVFNDALWKIMSKKRDSPKTMLPMITIPWFRWERNAIKPSNPSGIVRDNMGRSNIELEPGQSLTIKGLGGDFCGILESDLADQRVGARSLIAPNIPGNLGFVPKYSYEEVSLSIEVHNVEKELYPLPQKNIDYTFSEHPRVFYEHGMAVKTSGSNVQLRISNRRQQSLFGNVLMLLGKKWEEHIEGFKVVKYHAWLASLFRYLE